VKRGPTLKTMERQCEAFNKACPVGGRLMIKVDGEDEPREGILKHAAYVLSEHTPVAFVEGISGCYALTHLEPITDRVPPAVASRILLKRLGARQ